VIAKESVDETKDAAADGYVKINVVRGDIRVEGWARDKVSVVGTLDRKVKEFIFEVDGDDTHIAVKIPRIGGGWFGDAGSNLRIKVPENSNVEIGVVSTEVRVENILGGLELDGVSGDLEAEKIRDGVRISSVSGEIDLRDGQGRVKVRSVSGDIEADDVKGNGEFNTVSGSIVLNGFSDEVDLESVSGDIELIDGNLSAAIGSSVSGDIDIEADLESGADLDFDSVSGSVRLQLGGELNAEFDLESGSGSIRNRLTGDKPRRSRNTRDERLRFDMGQGEGRIVVNTSSGDIVLAKD